MNHEEGVTRELSVVGIRGDSDFAAQGRFAQEYGIKDVRWYCLNVAGVQRWSGL